MLKIKGIEHFEGRDYIPPDMNLVKKLLELIEDYFKVEHSPQFYADYLKISLRRLNGYTRFYVDKTVNAIIEDRIHQEALRMLSSTQLPVNHITYALGINDPSWFSRCFKKNTGYSPKEWRRAQSEV